MPPNAVSTRAFNLTFLQRQLTFAQTLHGYVRPPAPGLEDRRVEITGPTDRKMVVNALNSGAKTFMADFEGVLTMTSI